MCIVSLISWCHFIAVVGFELKKIPAGFLIATMRQKQLQGNIFITADRTRTFQLNYNYPQLQTNFTISRVSRDSKVKGVQYY